MFDGLLNEMGVQEENIRPLTTTAGWRNLDPSELAALSLEGLDVEAKDFNIDDDGFLNYRGRKVVLYIRDIKTFGGRVSNPKFHFNHCTTLESMMANGRFNRYVVTTKLDKKYKVIIDGNEKWEDLDVCRNCLKKVMGDDYENLNSREKNKLVADFDIAKAFEIYGYNESQLPIQNEYTAEKNDYTKDWSLVSRRMKAINHWTCKKCKRNLKDNPKYLDCHHKDANKSNNDPNNLEVLCVKCHSESEMHGHMKGEARLIEYLKAYKL